MLEDHSADPALIDMARPYVSLKDPKHTGPGCILMRGFKARALDCCLLLDACLSGDACICACHGLTPPHMSICLDVLVRASCKDKILRLADLECTFTC